MYLLKYRYKETYKAKQQCPKKVGWMTPAKYVCFIFGFGRAGWAVHVCGGDGCVVLYGQARKYMILN